MHDYKQIRVLKKKIRILYLEYLPAILSLLALSTSRRVRMTEQSLMARELGLDPSAQPVEMLLNPLKATVGQIGGTVETARSGKGAG